MAKNKTTETSASVEDFINLVLADVDKDIFQEMIANHIKHIQALYPSKGI